MKKIMIVFGCMCFLTGNMFAGVVKKTKSEVAFKKFGTFSSVQVEKISGEKKVTDSDNDFKGKGILGGLAAKAFLKSGRIGEIIDLSAMTIYQLDHKKKEYETRPIENLLEDKEKEDVSEEEEVEEEEVSEEGDIKIIRSEFKVEKTGESRVFNQFSCEKYLVTWITEWENLRTGQKGTDRLLTTVWTTPQTGDIKQALEEEKEFSREYMKRLGLNLDEVQDKILGTNWISLLGSIGQGDSPSQDSSEFSEEMKKIEGYPVLVDGKYYTKREGGEEEEEESGKDVKSLFGGLAKKALKKTEKSEDEEPAFSYYTELLEFSQADLGDKAFQVPAGYKKKG